jgi:hypothetical protein
MPTQGKRLFAIGREGGNAVEIGEASGEGMAFSAVGNNDIFNGGCHIVTKDLPKNAVVEGFVHGLAFDEHPGLGGVVKDEKVEAFGQFAELYFPFHGDIGGGIILYLEQVLNEVLPHPFFGSEAYPLAAKVIPDLFLILFRFPQLKWMSRIVDFDHALRLNFAKFTNNEDKRRNRY